MKKRIAAIVLVLGLLISGVIVFRSPAKAATGTVFIGSVECQVGDIVYVPVSIVGENLGSAQVVIQYDASKLEFLSGDNMTGGSGSITLVWWSSSGAGVDDANFGISFQALAAGDAYVTYSSGVVTDYNETVVFMSSVDGFVSVAGEETTPSETEETASSEARLESLQVGPSGIWPEFSPDVDEYYATVSSDTTQITISCSTISDTASYYFSSLELEPGTNNCYIVVTAEDGTQKTYWIYVTREEAQEESGESSEPTEESSEPTEESSKEPSEESTEESSKESNVPEIETISVTLNGQTKYVSPMLTDIELPEGFYVSTITYQGKSVEAAVREKGNVKLLYLCDEPIRVEEPKTSEEGEDSAAETTEQTEEAPIQKLIIPEGKFYVFDEKNQLLFPFASTKQPEGSLIFMEMGVEAEVPEGYTKTTKRIGTEERDVYTHPDQKELYLVYMMSPDGNVGWYQYDPAEGTFQRYVPREEAPVEVGPSAEELAAMEQAEKENADLKEQIAAKDAEIAGLKSDKEQDAKTIRQAGSSMARIRVIAIAMTALCLLELIVFFVASALSRSRRKKRRAAKKARKEKEDEE